MKGRKYGNWLVQTSGSLKKYARMPKINPKITLFSCPRIFRINITPAATMQSAQPNVTGVDGNPKDDTRKLPKLTPAPRVVRWEIVKLVAKNPFKRPGTSKNQSAFGRRGTENEHYSFEEHSQVLR